MKPRLRKRLEQMRLQATMVHVNACDFASAALRAGNAFEAFKQATEDADLDIIEAYQTADEHDSAMQTLWSNLGLPPDHRTE